MMYAIVKDGRASSCSLNNVENFANFELLHIPLRSQNVISQSSTCQIRCETSIWTICETYPGSIHVTLRVWNDHQVDRGSGQFQTVSLHRGKKYLSRSMQICADDKQRLKIENQINSCWKPDFPVKAPKLITREEQFALFRNHVGLTWIHQHGKLPRE